MTWKSRGVIRRRHQLYSDVHYQPSSHQQQAAPSVMTCEPPKVELPILLHNLRTFAIDPLHESCPSLVQKAIMKYRSLAYQKSVYLAERNEARRPTKSLDTVVDDTTIAMEPVLTPTSFERKHGLSDRPEGIKKKRKTIDGSENDEDAEESDSDSYLQVCLEKPMSGEANNEQLINAAGSPSSARSELIGNNLPNFVMPQPQSHLSIRIAPTSAAEQQAPGTSNESQYSA